METRWLPPGITQRTQARPHTNNRKYAGELRQDKVSYPQIMTGSGESNHSGSFQRQGQVDKRSQSQKKFQNAGYHVQYPKI